MTDNIHTVFQDELGPDGFVVRDAVPTSDVIRIRFADVDGLRALAIVLVGFAVLVHYTMLAPSPLLVRVADCASQGLALFLVVSGFTLAFPAMAVLRQDGRTYLDVGRFAIRRLLRIYPAYLVALVLTIVIGSLTAKYGIRGFRGITPSTIFANAFFFGDGFGNDGIRVLGLFMRAYVFFPVLLWLWARRPAIFIGLMVAFAIADVLTPAHAWTIAAFVPFMLGIIAADLRAQVHRFERIAPAITVGASIAAFIAMPYIALMPGFAFAPNVSNVDPLWSLAAFGLVVSVAAYRPLEAVFSFWMLRVLGAASYSISLALVPVAGLLAARVTYYSVGLELPLGLFIGFAFWQLVDRWFNDGDFRRNAATAYAGVIDDVLAKVHADRVFLGATVPEVDDGLSDAHQEEFVPNFYAPPPRASAADLAIVSRRTGSPEELQAEILETKARLQERSEALFAESNGPAEPAPTPVFAKPGFYRKPANPSDSEVDSEASAAPSEPQPAPAASGNGPAIRIRISSPTDGVFNNG